MFIEGMSGNERGKRPAFQEVEMFMQNAFQTRYLGILRWTMKNRIWCSVGAVSGSGKSTGNRHFVDAGGRKRADGSTHIPIVDVRVPERQGTAAAFGKALSMSIGRVPKMAATEISLWIAEQMVQCGVELLIVDDAHELSEDQFSFIRNLTDAVVRQRNGRGIGLCLVCASSGHDVPVASLMAQHPTDHSWVQFLNRMHPTHKYLLINNHTVDELEDILAGFEQLYRPQLPDLSLVEWTDALFRWLTLPHLDPGHTGRVTMGNVSKCVTQALRRAYYAGHENVTGDLLREVASQMTIDRFDPIPIDTLDTLNDIDIHVIDGDSTEDTTDIDGDSHDDKTG